MRKRLFLVGGAILVAIGILAASALLRGHVVLGEPTIFASPVQAGCYIAAPNDCRIHADPFTIDIASGKRLSQFSLVAIQGGTGPQPVLYDFHTDQSNPVPFIGTTYTPSLVAQDFAATCGKSYELSLQGKDSGDTSAFNLGLTTLFTCPSQVP